MNREAVQRTIGVAVLATCLAAALAFWLYIDEIESLPVVAVLAVAGIVVFGTIAGIAMQMVIEGEWPL